MNYLNEVRQALAADLVKAGWQVQPDAWVYPPKSDWGDLSLPCFQLASRLGLTPPGLAAELVSALQAAGWQASASGPYVNIILATTELAQQVLSAIESGHYGQNSRGQGNGLMIEYSNINTHKEYHLGHLRNIAYGDAVQRLYALNGWQVWPVSYVNDFGIHVAKTIWQWRRQPLSVGDEKDRGYLLGQAYVQAVQALSDNAEAEAEVSSVMRQIEARQGEDYQLWEQTRAWSLEYFASIYRELGVAFKEYYYESDFIDAGRRLVDELLARGILRRSQGAVIADLEAYDLGVLVLLRSDGTATYPVADLALAVAKFERHELKRSLYVVDNRQSLYFKQLFKILSLMGYEQDMVHLAYDFVKLPSGMMSSRTGNTVTYKELYSQVFDTFKTEIMNRHSDWSDDEVVETANRLTVGVLKFEMLKVGADKVITFDLEEACRFDGYTSVYIQYASARIMSLLRKAEFAWEKADLDLLTSPLEKQLLLELAKYPELVMAAADVYDPSLLAKYLFDLAKVFNDYYGQVPVLSAEEPIAAARLRLLAGLRSTMAAGLALLGIEIVEKM